MARQWWAGGRKLRIAHAALSWNLTTRLPPLSCGICRVIVNLFICARGFWRFWSSSSSWDRGGDPVFVEKAKWEKRAKP